MLCRVSDAFAACCFRGCAVTDAVEQNQQKISVQFPLIKSSQWALYTPTVVVDRVSFVRDPVCNQNTAVSNVYLNVSALVCMGVVQPCYTLRQTYNRNILSRIKRYASSFIGVCSQILLVNVKQSC